MDFSAYLDEMRNIQESVLKFLENEEDFDQDFDDLKKLLNNLKIIEDKNRFKSFLNLITQIGSNHHSNPNFFNKIEKILHLIKDSIPKYFINSEIYNIFKINKKILLFLIEEKIIIIDKYIAQKLLDRHRLYFFPEISTFMSDKDIFNRHYQHKLAQYEEKIPENFLELRKRAENDNYIYKLIQNDSIQEFISFVTQNNIPLDSTMIASQYEVINTDINFFSLIEYAAIYGSIKVFNYLRMNGVKLVPKLWECAIRGHNSKIIHILEENEVDAPFDSFLHLLCLAIDCHHNDIANYIENTYLNDEKNKKENLKEISNHALQSYNFVYLQNECMDDFTIYDFCESDYTIFVDYLLQNKDIDINKIYILIQMILIVFQI